MQLTVGLKKITSLSLPDFSTSATTVTVADEPKTATDITQDTVQDQTQLAFKMPERDDNEKPLNFEMDLFEQATDVSSNLQNVNNSDNILCLGLYKCDVGNKFLVFVIHAIYILFWTFVLDVICKAGYYELSWFIFLLPFLIFFLFLAMIIFKTNVLV